jgi:hypothetical protein
MACRLRHVQAPERRGLTGMLDSIERLCKWLGTYWPTELVELVSLGLELSDGSLMPPAVAPAWGALGLCAGTKRTKKWGAIYAAATNGTTTQRDTECVINGMAIAVAMTDSQIAIRRELREYSSGFPQARHSTYQVGERAAQRRMDRTLICSLQ